MIQIVEDIINEINEVQIHKGRKLMLYEMRPILEKHIAKVERPTGKWIRKVDDVGFISHICSECGAEIELENPIDNEYCWKCGSRMEAENE